MAHPASSTQLNELEGIVSSLESAVKDNTELSESVERLTTLTNALNEYFELADGE